MYNKVKKEKQEKTEWDDAIASTRKKIKKLEAAIAVFEDGKLNGDPWPGQSATQN